MKRFASWTIAALACACDGGRSPFSASPPAEDAAPSVVDASPPPCTRDGSFDTLERLRECMVPCRDPIDPRTVAVSLETLTNKVVPGGAGAMVARVKNVTTKPITLCLTLESLEPTGWDRLAGVGLPKPDTACERPRFTFPVRTRDTRDANVDELKVGSTVLCSRTMRIVLPPGRTLTKSLAWTALRLPPAPKPWEDDAGHKYYPKAIPLSLGRGTYRVETELPFTEAPAELKRVATSFDVAPAE